MEGKGTQRDHGPMRSPVSLSPGPGTKHGTSLYGRKGRREVGRWKEGGREEGRGSEGDASTDLREGKAARVVDLGP